MHTDTALWTIWFAWVLWILSALYPEESVIKWAAFLTTVGGLILLFRSLLLKRFLFMRLLKRENKVAGASVKNRTQVDNVTDTLAQPIVSPLLPPETADVIKPISTRKDTYISPEAHLTGDLEGMGNIVIEGQLDGNIRCSHQVRVESSGRVFGDIHAQHIVINGPVEGRFYADAITLQSEGQINGDIFTDALIIEKGGVFIGLSQLKREEKVTGKEGNITTLTLPTVQDTSTHTGLVNVTTATGA